MREQGQGTGSEIHGDPTKQAREGSRRSQRTHTGEGLQSPRGALPPSSLCREGQAGGQTPQAECRPEHKPESGRQDPGSRGLRSKPQPAPTRQDMLWTRCSCPPGHPHPTRFPWHLPTAKGNDREAWRPEVGVLNPRFNPMPPLPSSQLGHGQIHRATCSEVLPTVRQEPGHEGAHIWD